MKNEKHIYESDTRSLPTLKLVLGEIPDPDPDDKQHSFQVFGKNKSETDPINTLVKLINFFEK